MGLLDEYKKDLNKDIKIKNNRKKKFLKIKIWLFKNRRKIISVLLILIFLLFPEKIGNLIGLWLDKFLGSIIENLL